MILMKMFVFSSALSVPWRQISWGKETDLQYVQNYKPVNVKILRVLMYGQVGVGKSSFINSVSSAVRGRMSSPALVSAATSDSSFTTTYETHKIRRGISNSYPFVFNDIMGLEEGMGRGVRPEDIKLAMMGHVKEGYKFNPSSALSKQDAGYNQSPSPGDQVHVLVLVMSANVAEIKESVLQKMRSVREAARDLGIPQMAIVTHIDKACAATENDLKNVYSSKHLKKKMEDFSSAVGIPMSSIFPLKNYSEEIYINDDVDTLILSALTHMIHIGDDFIEKMFPQNWLWNWTSRKIEEFLAEMPVFT
ncbi:hypothetical protein PAMA_003639 [Pampus argenteus]